MNPEQPRQDLDEFKVPVDWRRVAELLSVRLGPIAGPAELEAAMWRAASEGLRTQFDEVAAQNAQLQQQVRAWAEAEQTRASAPPPVSAQPGPTPAP